MRILFVCTGNICRSPLAEGILRHKASKERLKVEVDSAGLEAFNIGDSPDSRSIAVAEKHQINIREHRGRLFKSEDFNRFDKIFIMDDSHYQALNSRSSSADDMAKVDYILNMVQPGLDLPVEDP